MRASERARDEDRRAVENRDGATVTDLSAEWRRVLAELWGTFLLVLVAAGGTIGVLVAPEQVTPAMGFGARGLIVMVMIYALGDVSGAHLNPAVTFAFALRRNFPWRRVPGYLAAQFVGAMLAVIFIKAIFGDAANLGASMPHDGLGDGRALALEALLTCGMVSTILGASAGGGNVGANAAISIGGYVAVAGFLAGFLTGASINPFRSLAPDLLRGDLHTTWVYILGPLLGATVAVGLEALLKGKPTISGNRAAQGQAGKRR